MEIGQIVIYILVYLFPAATLFTFALFALLSNPANRDNQLVAAIPFLYASLLFAEFIRHMLPIEYSPFIVTVLFGNLGLMMVGVAVHMYIQISRIYTHYKIWWYPYSLYFFPVLLIVLNLFSGHSITNSENFTQQGIWMVPEYNANYYATIFGSTILVLISLYLLTVGIRLEKSESRKKMLKFIRSGSVVTLVAMIILGYFSFGSVFPPHSYIYVGLIFSLYLVVAIYKFNLVPSLLIRYRTIFELYPNSVVIMNKDLDIIEFNNAAEKTILRFGLTGENVSGMLEQLTIREEFEIFIDKLHSSPLHLQETISFHYKGEPVHMRVDGAIMNIDSNKHYAVIFRDMTNEIESAALANQLAYSDSLTGLANRTYFIRELEQMIVLQEPHAVLLIDLNRFKQINDIYGHLSGDEVLRATARLLEEAFPKPHLVARLGGDEFTVLLKGMTRESQLKENIKFIRERGKSFHVTLGNFAVPIEYSVGGTLFKEGDTLDEVLMRADEEMYKDKFKDLPHERNSFD